MNKIILALTAAIAAVASVKVPEISPMVMASVIAGIELLQRVLKTEKPMSYLYGLGEVIAVLSKLALAVGEKLKKFSDVLPQRVQQ